MHCSCYSSCCCFLLLILVVVVVVLVYQKIYNICQKICYRSWCLLKYVSFWFCLFVFFLQISWLFYVYKHFQKYALLTIELHILLFGRIVCVYSLSELYFLHSGHIYSKIIKQTFSIDIHTFIISYTNSNIFYIRVWLMLKAAWIIYKICAALKYIFIVIV